VSKSYCIDLVDFRLALPIGLNRKPLIRGLGGLDLRAVLQDEGFSDFTRYGSREKLPEGKTGTTWHRMHGIDVNGLRNIIQTAVLGIPREALVDIRPLGRRSKRYLLTFTY